MNRRITVIMILAVLGGFGVILLMNVAALLGYIPSRYIAPNDVRGMAIEHNHLLYTLNFDQQNTLVDIFNRSIPVAKDNVESRKVKLKKPLEIDRIVIYRFNAPDIEIHPYAFVSKSHSVMSNDESENISFVYSTPDWNQNGFLEESALDNLYKTLINAYDH